MMKFSESAISSSWNIFSSSRSLSTRSSQSSGRISAKASSVAGLSNTSRSNFTRLKSRFLISRKEIVQWNSCSLQRNRWTNPCCDMFQTKYRKSRISNGLNRKSWNRLKLFYRLQNLNQAIQLGKSQQSRSLLPFYRLAFELKSCNRWANICWILTNRCDLPYYLEEISLRTLRTTTRLKRWESMKATQIYKLRHTTICTYQYTQFDW